MRLEAVFRILVFSIVVTSCISVARLADLPKERSAISFAILPASKLIMKDKSWSNRTEFSYYIKVNKMPKDTVLSSIYNALKREGYYIRYTNADKDVILAKRGLRANEWATVTGVYLNFQANYLEICIKSKITQDVTGGWSNDRAEEIGILICKKLGRCLDSYPLNDQAR